MMMLGVVLLTPRFERIAVLVIVAVAVASWTGVAAAETLPGCASGEAPGLPVFTVGVSAAGTPFVTYYVASAPTASGNVGCAAPSGAATFIVNSPGVYVYPTAPVVPGIVPVPVNLLQVGSHLLTVPANPRVQVYQIAPGFYVVRSIDPSQNVNIVLPLPGPPTAPNTGPIPSVAH